MEDLKFNNLSNQPGQSLLRTQVYEYLRNELKAANLKPGMLISMNQIMKNLGISYAVWAILLGLIISNTVGTPEWIKPHVVT